MTLSFTEIFERELDVINYRRRAVQDGVLARARASGEIGQGRETLLVPRPAVTLAAARGDMEQRGTARLNPGHNLTGVSLSGGGIRSASFCLGVLQGLDSLSEDGAPNLLDSVDYLSTVSGGGYIGTSLISGLMQPDYTFPFDSRLDEQETPETKHLRDFSNFLAPNGLMDYLTSAVLMVRGLIVNAFIVLPLLLFLAALTVACNPSVADLRVPDVFGIPLNNPILPIPFIGGVAGFALTIDLALGLALILFFSAIYTSLTFKRGTLSARELLGKCLSGLLILVLVAALFEAQPFILAAMFAAAPADTAQAASPEARGAFAAIGHVIPTIGAVLIPIAAVLISSAQKLANIVKATVGKETWTGLLKRYGSRFALYLAAFIVPALLWIAYLYLSFWAIRPRMDMAFNPAAPDWLSYLAGRLTALLPDLAAIRHLGPLGTAYLVAAALIALLCLLIGPNANSLHRMYRDRLSRAFLFERACLTQNKKTRDVDRWTFSSLKPYDSSANSWQKAAALSPYLLVNTAINLAGSEELNKRGRNADTFIFSPLHIGSNATGYVGTKDIEDVVEDLSLATAMAISGAAASANMGAHTIRILTASLSLLNIRLGYWLANPRCLSRFRRPFARWAANIGTYFFLRETLGKLDEETLNVYLTDGGHIENLGIYELLKRRCAVILAVDAEADQAMTFSSLIKLQIMARIDLGVRIDLPWQAIRESALAVTGSAPYGPGGFPGAAGPHAAIGRIEYGADQTGVLIYIKSSLSGDENDYIIDYKRRNSTFPHETTADQFFSEEQFEVYRALGFHAARRLLTGADRFGTLEHPPPHWAAEVRNALLLLNIPPDRAGEILAHC